MNTMNIIKSGNLLFWSKRAKCAKCAKWIPKKNVYAKSGQADSVLNRLLFNDLILHQQSINIA